MQPPKQKKSSPWLCHGCGWQVTSHDSVCPYCKGSRSWSRPPSREELAWINGKKVELDRG